MTPVRSRSLVALAAVATLLLASCATNEMYGPLPPDALRGEFNGSGASSQGSASEVWIAAFQTANPGVTINYSPDGSGAGRTAFMSGGVAYAGSDSVLNARELASTFGACAPGTTAIDLPIYISPIAVIFNIDGLAELNLDARTIAGIFAGDITNWSDPAIARLNPGAALPDSTITAVHRSDDSGTTTNFTDYLAQNAPEVWDAPADDTFPFHTGEAAQGTSGVVAAVTHGRNAIGYADASRAGKLGVAAIKVGDTFVQYSSEAAAKVVAESRILEGRAPGDLALDLDRTTTNPTHYPLVLVSYLIVCRQYADPALGTLVKAYASFIASPEGQALAAKSAGAAPLSAGLSERIATVIGTMR